MKSVALGFLLAVLASLVAAGIGGLVSHAIVRLKLSEHAKKYIRHTFLLILAGTVAIPVYYGGLSWSKGTAFSATQFWISFFALLAQLVTVGYLLFRFTRGEAEIQYEKPFSVKVGHGETPDHHIRVRALKTDGLDPAETLCLNWSTFTDAVKFLVEQIKGYSPAFPPKLCVGINHTGQALASLLAGALTDSTTPVGVISTKGPPGHPVKYAFLPETPNEPEMILVTDGEVKRGKSSKHVIMFLQEKYPNARIKFAALVASKIDGPLENLGDLATGHRGVFEEDKEYLPDFLAFVSSNKIRLTREYMIE
jgi:hypothetical protein